MPKRTDILATLTPSTAAIVLCSFLIPVLGRTQVNPHVVCDDVSTIDLNNGVLDLGGLGSLTFRDGRACGSEEVSIQQDRNCACGSGKCDWEMQISQDIHLMPEPGMLFRLLNVSEEHLTGSGAWGHVLLFECRHGQLNKVMDRQYLYGVNVTATANSFELESNYWLPSDARCCPSRKQRESYRWRSKQHRYIRTQRVVLRRDAQAH